MPSPPPVLHVDDLVVIRPLSASSAPADPILGRIVSLRGVTVTVSRGESLPAPSRMVTVDARMCALASFDDLLEERRLSRLRNRPRLPPSESSR